MNKILVYRKMLNKSQSEIAGLMGISTQAYSNKENGKTEFRDSEKIIFKNLLKSIYPSITIDEIFFDNKLSFVEFREV
ncbi:helix-turn-helix transcriptional regulator [Mammaliicoccus lentus]|uniref:Helix-turn-helix domain-containing protein n=1 Tax=Mammaliicoccus lentus TaxID=42858 RepID=A0AAX3W450_MAMLE|nr:helix-turn-helix domain-containing protein [Mammaliicoccus lentus]WHI60053.1 helix-turn-helix domain-containing protein [Mammaliicoccus lentus]